MAETHLTALAVIIVVGTGSPGTSMGLEVANRPDWSVGDSWRFTRRNVGTGETSAWSRKIVEVTKTRLRVENENEVRWWADLDFNSYNRRGTEYRHSWFHWPLKVGETWGYKQKVFIEAGEGQNVVERRVIAIDTISVPAGTFECFRIESTANHFAFNSTLVYRHAYASKLTYVDWYCPAVRFTARREETETSASGPIRRLVDELESYQLGR